jgi:hypothetical protein
VNNYTKTILWTLKWNPHIKHLLTFLWRMDDDTCKITFLRNGFHCKYCEQQH